MSFSVRPVGTQKELKIFVKLPYTLYREDATWVEPLISEEKKRSIFFICKRLTFTVLFLLFCRAGLSQAQTLPSRSKPEMSLLEAMNRRMSVRSYKKDPVETGKLSWLLWATAKISWEGEIPGMIVIKMDNQMFQYKDLLLQQPSVPP